jgi:hypothetical protein
VPSPSSVPLTKSEQIVRLQQELPWARLKIQSLEESLRLERIKKYGPGSEKLSSAQLELLELEPGVSNAEVEEESKREPLPGRRSNQGDASIRDGRNLPLACRAWSE